MLPEQIMDWISIKLFPLTLMIYRIPTLYLWLSYWSPFSLFFFFLSSFSISDVYNYVCLVHAEWYCLIPINILSIIHSTRLADSTLIDDQLDLCTIYRGDRSYVDGPSTSQCFCFEFPSGPRVSDLLGSAALGSSRRERTWQDVQYVNASCLSAWI